MTKTARKQPSIGYDLFRLKSSFSFIVKRLFRVLQTDSAEPSLYYRL